MAMGPRRGAQRRGGGQRGASLVELAIVLPLLSTFLFGIIDFGSVYSDQQALRQADRDAARQAVVGSVGSDNSCSPVGASPTGSTLNLVCRAKNFTGFHDPSNVRVMVSISPSWANTNTLLLCMQYKVSSLTGFFAAVLNGKVMTSRVQMRIENTNGLTITNVQETSLPGGSWSSCVVQ